MNQWLWRSLLSLAPLYLSLPAWAADPAAVEQLLTTNQCPGCDLSGADLAGANLFGANLVNANLTGANLSGANLGNATLIGQFNRG
ncbi:MAG: pentapeptide repeat-containing protein [Spirulina sp. SIO3F2]|nr:pentapeptide repeat-containing protein [Spirulina sp. SIO3F2]